MLVLVHHKFTLLLSKHRGSKCLWFYIIMNFKKRLRSYHLIIFSVNWYIIISERKEHSKCHFAHTSNEFGSINFMNFRKLPTELYGKLKVMIGDALKKNKLGSWSASKFSTQHRLDHHDDSSKHKSKSSSIEDHSVIHEQAIEGACLE